MIEPEIASPTRAARPPPAGPPGAGDVPGEGWEVPPRACYHVTRLSLWYRYGFLFLLTLLGVGLMALFVPMVAAGGDLLTGLLLALWVLALLRYWAFALMMPHRVCLEGEDALVLHTLLRKRTVPCERIIALRVSPIYPSYLKIVTADKKTFTLINHVDGLHELIGRLRRINPDLETRGC